MKRYVIITLTAVILALVTACLSNLSRRFITITFTGDILLDRGVREMLKEKGVNYPYEKVKDILNSADITFGNLECPVTDEGAPVLKRPYLIFRGDPDNINALRGAGYDILNLANNHVMDYGHAGLEDTMDKLLNNNINYVGAGKSREEAYKPVFIEKGGIKTGFLSFSDFPSEGYVYSETEADIARTDEKKMHDSIVNAKKQCDFLIVSFHWGTEYSFYPGDVQKKYAHEAADCGADLIVGHHPHVLQSIEKYNNSYIFYSLGNFIFDRQIYPKTDETIILRANVDKNGVKNLEILPVRIVNCQPEIMKGKEGGSILEDLIRYSEGKGADIRVTDENIAEIYK